MGAAVNADEYEKIRAEIWAEPWKDPSLFPDLLNRVVTELGKVALEECTCYPGGFSPETYEGVQEHCAVHGRPAYWAAEMLRDLGGRAKSGVPFDEPATDEPPYWSANL